MAFYNTSEFRAGLKIMQEGEPCVIIDNEFVKPGKGQAFSRVKIRRLISGRSVEKTFKSGESVEAADVVELHLTYLYNDGKFWHFMDNDSFDQLAAEEKVVGDSANWLVEQAVCVVTLWDGCPIAVAPPNFIEVAILETDPGLKGDTAGSGGKSATLVTGAVVKVPLFVQVGEVIKVDTRSREYVARVR